MTKDDEKEFQQRNTMLIEQMADDNDLLLLSRQAFMKMCKYEYSYHFEWLGRPIIQFPQDMIAVQEIIWRVKPELIIETGIARGGSLMFSASILELIGGSGKVIGVDIDIRKHNRTAIEQHPLYHRIEMIEGSSLDVEVVDAVTNKAQGKKVLVLLDSHHTHEHVLSELELYSPLVKSGSYVVVFDTIIEDMPDDFFPDRPWGKGNNPATAVREFLSKNNRFLVDKEFDGKLLISVAPGGYLKCVED
jgi:cephalosporin hydroxylase